MTIPKRVMITRTAMCGGGLAYEVLVPIKHVPNYNGTRYTTVCRDNGGQFVRFEDATTPEEHFAMPLGWERYEDKLRHNKACEPIAFQLAKVAFPELEKLDKLPFLWATGLLERETHRDVMLDGQNLKPMAVWTYEDGKPVKVAA